MRTYPLLAGIATDPSFPAFYKRGTSVPLRTTQDGRLVPAISVARDIAALPVIVAGTENALITDTNNRLLVNEDIVNGTASGPNGGGAGIGFTQAIAGPGWLKRLVITNTTAAIFWMKAWNDPAAIAGTTSLFWRFSVPVGAYLSIDFDQWYSAGLALAITLNSPTADVTAVANGGNYVATYRATP